MTPDNTGGQTSTAEPPTESALDKTYEELRRLAVARLVDHLEMTTPLIERCDHLAALPKGDRVRPLFAAAGLIRSSALIAQAFSRAAKVEQCRRTIIEHIQPPIPEIADLISNLEKNIEKKKPEDQVGDRLEHELRMKMLRYMKLLADEKLDPAIKQMSDDADEASKKNAAETFDPALSKVPDNVATGTP